MINANPRPTAQRDLNFMVPSLVVIETDQVGLLLLRP
jgi:hypothetical protein